MNRAKPIEQQDLVQPPSYTDRQFLHTYSAGAWLPLVQATITGVMSMVGTVTLLYAFDAIDLFKPAVIVGTLVWVLTWLYLQRRWLSLTMLERALQLDLNRDGTIGEVETKKPETVIRIDEVKGNGHFQSSTYRLPISDRTLKVLAEGLLAGRAFSEREWTGFGKPFSTSGWRRLMQVMLARDLVQRVNDKDVRQGVELTPRGWAMMEELAPGWAKAEVVEEDSE